MIKGFQQGHFLLRFATWKSIVTAVWKVDWQNMTGSEFVLFLPLFFFFLASLKCELTAGAHRGNLQCLSLFEKEGRHSILIPGFLVKSRSPT